MRAEPRRRASASIAGLLFVLALTVAIAPADAQIVTGEIYGRVTDTTGAVLPGVTVTITSPALLLPLVVQTASTGVYRVPLIPIGTYRAQFELAGFRTVIRDEVRIEIGLSARIDTSLSIGGIEQVVQVTVSPLIDLKDPGRNNRFTRDTLEAIPSARDPWAIIGQSAGVAMDRQNVGGSTSGQQGNYVVRGTTRESKWSLDGVDITDMAATGTSPVYYDFGAFEEIQVTTGGADVTMQSSGLAINLVTKSGTDRLRGSGRYYVTDDRFESNNVTDDLRRQGVYTGNPVQNIQDYGVEAGGPLVKTRAWIWGGYGTQRIKVGVNNVYRSDAACQAMKQALRVDPLGYSLQEIQTCLVTDKTLLDTYNLKFAMQTTRNNQISFLFNAAEKIRPTRELSDLRPVQTSLRQGGITTRPDLGSRWWKTGIPKTYRWSDRHVFSDRLMLEGSYAHVGNNYIAAFQDESLRNVQPAVDLPAGSWSRSYMEDVNLRPASIVSLTGNYLLAGVLRGDHEMKFGVVYRNDLAHREVTWGGDAIARFLNGAPWQALILRRTAGEYGLHNRSFYVQDSYTRRRLTVNAGFRFDHQHDYVNPATVAATAFYGQPTFTGLYQGVVYAGRPFDQLPALSFDGKNPNVSFNTVSPRLAASLDLTGSGRTVLKWAFARYAGQLGASAPVAMVYSPASNSPYGSVYVTYPWKDLNGDGYIQANEIVLTATPSAWLAGYDYTKPTSTRTSGTVDPNLVADRSNEIIVSVERLLGPEFVVTASYIWRRYNNARWNDTTDWTSADYTPATSTPTCSTAGARCNPVTYYNPLRTVPVAYVLTNQRGFWRGYQGFEVTARKRLAARWMLNASFSYNDARAHYDSANGYEDPTNIENVNNAQYAPQYASDLASANLSSILVNAKWIFRVSGSYLTPVWGINAAAFYDSRSGYPFPASIQITNRTNGAGNINVYLDKLGDNRLPALRTLDLRVDRQFAFRRVKLRPAVDVFNLLNAGTPLLIRPVQNAQNANQISAILSPRVIRFGLHAEW